MSDEKGKMTLARALKEKERIARRLTKASELFVSVNSVRAGEQREIDAQEAYESMQSLRRRYAAMKRAIAVANAGISPTLAEMLSVKAELAFYTNLTRCPKTEYVDEWMEDENGGRERKRVKVEYDVFIDEKRRREIQEELTTRLDNLQDEVDQYNATHFVELPEA